MKEKEEEIIIIIYIIIFIIIIYDDVITSFCAVYIIGIVLSSCLSLHNSIPCYVVFIARLDRNNTTI